MAKKENNELEKRNQAFLIYQNENGIARVHVRFEGEDVWLNVEQMMELFDASQQDVSYHINQIYAENEQDPERTHKKFLLVRQEGNRSVRRNMSHYNLDMIIAVPIKVTHALYLDMGRGWNYAWYRDKDGVVKEVFPESKLAPSYKYRTNWITFYK